MARFGFALAVQAALVVACAGIALAHGGGHGPPIPPPPGGAPPGTTSPTPPPSPGPMAPTTPGSGAPNGPGPSAPQAPSPPTGGSPPPAAGPAPAGPLTGAPATPGTPTPTAPVGMNPLATAILSGPNLESWRYWWAFNRDRYLRLKAHVDAPESPRTPEFGDVTDARARTSMRPTRPQLARDVVPVLRDALEKETNRDLLSATLIALAKIGEDPEPCARAIEKFLSNPSRPVAETAAISLGILGSSEGLETLSALYKDQDEGRRLVGGAREVPWRTRAMAAYGLGLLGAHTRNPHHRRRIQDDFVEFLAGEGSKRAAQKDVRVATILALGMVPDPEERAALALRQYFQKNHDREALICAQVAPIAARLLAPAPAPDRAGYAEELAKSLDDRETRCDRFVRASVPLALGLLTRSDDPHAPRVIRALQESVEKDRARNPEASYFALIALGQIAGSGPTGSEAEKSLLARATAPGGRVTTRGWAALALGVAGFDQAERIGRPKKDAVSATLLETMKGIRDPEQLGAFAVALGLRGATPAAGELIRLLDDVKVDDFRGFFALGLGLMGANEAREPIQRYVKTAFRRPTFFQQAAIGLALLGDKSVVGTLTKILGDKECQSFASQSAVADALGYVGDYRALEPLIAMLNDRSGTFTDSSRTFAAVALGVIGDKDELPWNARISADFNYHAVVETLMDLIWEN